MFVTPKYCISIVFSFSWELKWPLEKLKQCFRKIWGDKQRALWYVMVFSGWSIVVSSAAVFVCSRNAPTQDASFQLAGEARYETEITAMESKCSSAAHVNKFPS